MSKLAMTKLEREIEEMENTLEGNPALAATPEPQPNLEEEVIKEPSGLETVPVVAELDQDEDEEEVTTESKPKRVSWKKRYSTYKASSDATIYQLRQELAQSTLIVSELRDQVDELRKVQLEANPDQFRSAFSEEDVNIFGEEALQSMQKATESIVAPIKQELEDTRKKLKAREQADIQSQSVSAKQIFITKLANLVPDYEEIDVDPAFAKWVQLPDPASGFQRLHLFKTAEANGDVGRVAGFMTQFKEETQGKPDPLETHITPTTSAKASAPTRNESTQMTQAYIDKFYNDAAKGLYKGREKLAQEIEAKIDKALLTRAVAFY